MRIAGSVRLFVGLLVCFVCESDSLFAAPSRPNIVLILADDLGYGDVSCYNREASRIATPNVDRLATQGMRFTDAHTSSGVCSPSRYALLTGRYHWRSRLQSGIVQYLERPLIAPDRLTIAGLLKQSGYHTACLGKWHLGWDWEIPQAERELFNPGRGKVLEPTAAHRAAWERVYGAPLAGGPITRGFDTYFGTDVPNWPPYCFIDQDRTVGIPTEFMPASAFRNGLLSIQGPALPNWSLEEVLPRLIDRACAHIRERSAAEEPYFLYLPLTSPHTPIAVPPQWQGKSGLDEPIADFIIETDAEVGRVLAAIEESGESDRTLVIFTSDNGPAPFSQPLIAKGHQPSGPLRGRKADAWEGGHRVPFIVRWPGITSPGSVCEQLVHQADLFRTIADTLEVALPDNAGEDSFSLLPLLKGSREPIREHAISHASNGLPALRRGSWKILFGPEPARAGSGNAATEADENDKTLRPPVQLYDLASDLGERRNLAAEQPQLVAELTTLMETLVENGRSTPGTPQHNDVPVNWRKFLKTGAVR